MIIVSGSLPRRPGRARRLPRRLPSVIEQARVAPGCLDFHLSPDPIEPDRINVYEQWESVEAVEAFRGSGPSDEQGDAIRSASVHQHEIASSVAL